MLQPGRVVVVYMSKAPLGGRLVEPFPRPLGYHHSPTRPHGRRHPVKDKVQVRHVMQRRARDERVDGLRQRVSLKFAATVIRPLGGFGVDAHGVVPGRPERGHQPARRAAADLDHDRRSGRQRGLGVRPDLRHPAVITGHAVTVRGRRPFAVTLFSYRTRGGVSSAPAFPLVRRSAGLVARLLCHVMEMAEHGAAERSQRVPHGGHHPLRRHRPHPPAGPASNPPSPPRPRPDGIAYRIACSYPTKIDGYCTRSWRRIAGCRAAGLPDHAAAVGWRTGR
jgi:hypothetical protein